jgi:hypothetical protein
MSLAEDLKKCPCYAPKISRTRAEEILRQEYQCKANSYLLLTDEESEMKLEVLSLNIPQFDEQDFLNETKITEPPNRLVSLPI